MARGGRSALPRALVIGSSLPSSLAGDPAFYGGRWRVFSPVLLPVPRFLEAAEEAFRARLPPAITGLVWLVLGVIRGCCAWL